MKTWLYCLIILLFTGTVYAQEPRIELPSSSARKVADIASWITVAVPVTFDIKRSFECANQKDCFILQGARVGVTLGVVYLTKWIVKRDRPCAPQCGRDNPHYSFFSGHTAIAFSTIGGTKLNVSIPFAVTTGGLRIAAGKHWISDTLVGAGVGFLTSRIR